jgi:predicted DNA-binding transcriptional regulator AlpA
VDELRETIASQAIGLDEMAERFDVSVHTLTLWARGGVPQGAPPFPPPVKSIGKARVYVAAEVAPWIASHHRRATPPK